MATIDPGATGPPMLAPSGSQDDPFNEATPKMEKRKSSHRFSAFDTQLFASYQPTSSPATAKRALEAHLTETDKRLEEASKLGTALVQQRQDLEEKLKEVETHIDGEAMSPELREQLAEVEKEYNELGRESARAFLAHKSRAVSGEGETPARAASPTKFSSQATDSPSKMSVPSRKQRNQPTNRVGDIEFVTQISTSLLSQVRQLQAVLAERDEALRNATVEKSRIELDNEGLMTRLKALDESEQRFKDENWSLETQTHELMAAAKDSSTREQKLQQSLALVQSQKNAAQRELDDVKQAHGKVSDDLAALKKIHDSETSGLRKNMLGHESERDMLQKKIDDLTSQNQELAKAMTGRFRQEEDASVLQLGSDPEEFFIDNTDTDHSPPPSPTKGGARNSMLESETLKSSLHHAHRMIQSLKSNIHREKTEKLELKRMLQESRDELEQRRNDPNGASKRAKTKSQQDASKKTVRIGALGAGRQSQTSIEDDPDWIDNGENTGRPGLARTTTTDTSTDAYQTAAETDDAFTTADERVSDSEAFHTGNAGGDSSDELTETEGPGRATDATTRKVSQLPYPNNKRESFISTATDSDDDDAQSVARTPVQGSLRSRNKPTSGNWKSRLASEEPSSSPIGMRNSPASSVGAGNGQSLFAELEDMENGSDDETTGANSQFGTPVRGAASSFISTPSKLSNSVGKAAPKPTMTDSGMMTDEWQPAATPATGLIATAAAATGLTSVLPQSLQPVTPSKDSREMKDTGFQPSRQNTPTPTEKFAAVVPPRSSSVRKTKPAMAFSSIITTDIKPIDPRARPVTQILVDPERPTTAVQTTTSTPKKATNSSQEMKDVAKGGVLGSVLGWAVGKRKSVSEDVENDDTPTKPGSRSNTSGAKSPFMEISPNISRTAATSPPIASSAMPTHDTGAQTTLSSAQIESLLVAKATRTTMPPIITNGFAASETPTGAKAGASKDVKLETPTPTRPRGSSGGSYSLTPREIPYPPAKSIRRPGSASSYRSSLQNDAPPLPTDHRQAIAAAQMTPSKDKAEGSMGPPTMTAAAYRAAQKQPQTAPQTPGSITSMTPRARHSAVRSMRSRRSSVSSFESELDARFNIRPDNIPMGGFDGNTDPRMIQAITQTMIGEYLWKYTRKAGRGEMSAKRHRRFFWVHPYTRTLYWSDQDPSTAGRAQLKAKSVAIEAVRVVADDNPMPPGLHRKSLVVITPGRDIKFTATTGQRHETWFNALSYLLLRSSDAPPIDPTGLTAEDVAEFNPGFGGRAGGSRVSLSSYNSRTNTTRRSLASLRGPSPERDTMRRRVLVTPHASNSTRNYNNASVGSRISSLWRPSRASNLSSLHESGAVQQEGSIYNASVVNDSAEDVRKVLEKQDQDADRLENVRACCDGKHDVGSLSKGGRHSHKHRH